MKYLKENSRILPVGFWLLSFPFGIALQNIFSILVLIYLFFELMRRQSAKIERHSKNAIFLILFLSISFVASLSLSTYFNLNNSLALLNRQTFGYIAWIIAPPLFYVIYGGFSSKEWNFLLKIIITLCLLWALIAMSQYVWGWRVLGSSFVFEGFHRPKGLYSHPLSFAYAAILFWPLSQLNLFRNRKKFSAWVFLISVGICLVLTQSRVVQVVSLFMLIWNIWQITAKQNKVNLILAGIFCLGLFFTIDNPVAKRFHETFSKEGHDRHSTYKDDRLAFWHVHWLMVKERPFIGHGFGLDTKYRLPYYKKIGLEGFLKPYEAHNMYLQILANGGIIALLFFLLWLSSYLYLLILRKKDRFIWDVGTQTLLCFFAASFTQNAFQDASVRSVLTMFCTGILCACLPKSAV